MVWDRVWVNVCLATMEEGYGIVRDAAIACADGRIVWIGAQAALPAAPERLARLVIDGGGVWITPGLIDAHTHLVYAGDRSAEFEQRLRGVSYQEIARQGGGILSTMRATRAASDADLLDDTLRRARRLLSGGVTTVEIKSGYGLTLEAECRQLRIARAVENALPVRVRTSFLGAHALPPEYAGDRDGYVSHLIRDMLPAIVRDGLADSVDAFCESIAFQPPEVDRLFQAAAALGLPIKLHADQLSDLGGAALVARHRGLSADHVEYTSDAGVRAMADAGTVATLLPGAFAFVQETQKPPVAAFRAHGVPMAVATDCNPGTSPALDLTTMMNMACTLFGLTPSEALAGTTRVAARALGLIAETGRLAVGLSADFALWPVSGPHELSYWIGGVLPSGRVFRGVPDV